MRCLTLAHGLISRGWRCTFAGTAETQRLVKAMTTSDTGFLEVGNDGPSVLIDRLIAIHGSADAMIVDHYGLDKVFETESRRLARSVVCIDDLADRGHDCDILLDQSLGRNAEDYQSLVPSGARVLIGPSYALLRPEFSELRHEALARRIRQDFVPQRVLLSFGATDAQNVTSRAIQALKEPMFSRLEVDIVLSSAAPHIESVRKLADVRTNTILHVDTDAVAALMAAADLALGAGGVTTWERCAVGLPSIVVVTASNQVAQIRAAEAAGAVVVLGDASDVSVSDFIEVLQRMLSDTERLRAMALQAASVCDGQGCGRVVEELEKLVGRKSVGGSLGRHN